MVIPPTDPRVSYSNGRFYHHSTAAREHPSHHTPVTAAVTPDAASRGKVPVRWSWTGFGSFPQYSGTSILTPNAVKNGHISPTFYVRTEFMIVLPR
eukprot:COSAG06_NODE_5871_length_3234_cov_1.776467_4_plen_96_part_00